ncbi:hypothetical protein [Streptosporangium amethystogenes]|uniref:hypothetical protein n=1 Tax=Streptosporangium amethystogenes TaxID=2002 RepID=UPI0004C4E3D7|nr:hypothetical protein [Streptosporangium amethystogenes]
MGHVDPKSWFDHLSLPQRIIAIIASLIGLIGGVTLLLVEPPTWPAVFLIFVFVLFSAAILHNIPRIRAWVGSGYQLGVGFFLVFKSVSGEFETTFFRVAGLIVGVPLLVHLVIRGVIMEWRRQDSHRTIPQPD